MICEYRFIRFEGEPVSYTHLDVYKRQLLNKDTVTQVAQMNARVYNIKVVGVCLKAVNKTKGRSYVGNV